MSDQAYRSSPAPAPAVDTPAQGPAGSGNRVVAANTAAGGGNAYAASMQPPRQQDVPDDPGFFDKLGALTGSTHMRNLLGQNGQGVVWDDREKGANKPNVDVWGKDRVRIPKLRIASITREGLSAKNISADGVELNERDKTAAGQYAAELQVPTASARELVSAAPPLQAAGIDLAGVKVRREFQGSELTDFFGKPGTTTVEVASARLTGFDGAGVRAGSVTATGLQGATDGARHRVGAASVHAEKLAAAGASAGTADLQGFQGSVGPDGSQVSATSLTAADVSAGGAHFVTVGTHGLSARAAGGALSASAQRIDVGGATGPGGFGVQAGTASGASLTRDADGTRLGAQAVHLDGVAAGGVSARTADLQNGSVQLAGGAVTTRADALQAGGIQTAAGTVEQASAQNAELRTQDGASRLGVGTLDARNLDLGGVHLDAAQARGVGLDVAPGQTRLGAQALQGSGLRAGSVQAAQLQADNAALTLAGDQRSATLGSARASGITAGDATVREASLEAGTWSGGAAGQTLGAGKLQASGIRSGNVAVDSASATDARATVAGAEVDASAAALAGSGVRLGQVSAARLDATGARVQHGAQGTRASAATLGAKTLDTGAAQVADARLTGAAVRVGDDGTTVDARKLAASGVVAGDVRVGSVTGEQAAVQVGGGNTRAQLGAGSARDLRVGNDVRVDAANVSGARVSTGAGGTTAGADKLGATGVRVGDNRVAGVNATGARLAMDGQGLHAGATRVDATGIRAGGATVESANARNLALDRTRSGAQTRTTATASRLGATGIAAGSARVGTATAGEVDVRLAQGPGGTTLDASGTASATGLSYTDGANRTSADAVNLGRVNHHQAGGHSTTRSSGLTAQGVRHTQVAPAARGGAGSSGTGSAGGAGGPSLTQQAANLVGSADLRASVPLNAQTMNEGTRRVTVKPGTTAYVEVQVRGGRVVPANTRAQFSTPLDTWAWTSVPGVYMSREGKLYAAVDGLWDIDLTESVTGAMGQKGEVLPLRVADLARAAGSGDAGAGRSTGGGRSSGGGGTPAADLSRLQVQGTVGLNAGTLRTDGMSATLGAGPGANVAQITKDGDRSLSVAFSKLLLDAFGVQAGGARVDVKNVQAQNATVRQEGNRTSAGVGSLSTGATTLTR